jgi:hypothetical protein
MNGVSIFALMWKPNRKSDLDSPTELLEEGHTQGKMIIALEHNANTNNALHPANMLRNLGDNL